MSGQHPDLDALADTSCGMGDPATVEHLASCAACREALAELDGAQVPLTAALSGLPVPAPPADLEDRLLAALARERRTVLPLVAPAPRRRPVWLVPGRLVPVGAAAGLLAVLATGAVLLGRGSTTSSTTSGGATVAAAPAPQVRRLDSGTDYRRTGTSFARALPQLLSSAGPTSAGPTSAAAERKADAGAAPAQAADPLARLRDDAALARCLSSLTPPEDPGLPLAVDYATYDGAPALVVVLPSRRPGMVDVYVVGPACAAADADLRYFIRVERP